MQISLDDKVWKNLKGGYGLQYDASPILRKLEITSRKEEQQDILKELWDELHHQGDVGIASYLALPQLVKIAKEKKDFSTDWIGLCLIIEHQRHQPQNPTVPEDYIAYYEEGLRSLDDYARSILSANVKEDYQILAFSAIATCSGYIKLGQAILELDDPEILNEFLSQF